jgi:hypothetical protein
MQVFTTIYLAEKLPVPIDHAETDAVDRSELIELESSARECIVTLESRKWFDADDVRY